MQHHFDIAYSGSPFTLSKGTAMTTATPTSSGGTVVSWAISPSLPAGLTFSTSTGAISGTPTTVNSATNYTVTATNTGGSATVTISILVNDAAPSGVAYSGSPFTLTKGVAMTTVQLHLLVAEQSPHGPFLQHSQQDYPWTI